jgi:hypothetical protein
MLSAGVDVEIVVSRSKRAHRVVPCAQPLWRTSKRAGRDFSCSMRPAVCRRVARRAPARVRIDMQSVGHVEDAWHAAAKERTIDSAQGAARLQRHVVNALHRLPSGMTPEGFR